MARRIVRTTIQFAVLSLVLAGLLFFLDLRYRVLPASVHNFLPEHHAGAVVTDIAYKQCARIGSCVLDPSEGWVRINKDVFLGQAWLQQGFLHYKVRKEAELKDGEKVLVDVRVSRSQPKSTQEEEKAGVQWEARPGGLWVRRQEKVVDDAVTGVDLLFGADAVEVRVGWAMKEGVLNVGDGVRVTVRKGAAVEAKKPVVRMRKDHKFKIIQVADLHLSTGTGACRDAEPPSTRDGCEADPRTLSFLERILDEEQPDLAVLTGDQVNGDTSPDVQTAVFKFAEPFIKRKIPYATILGNHDDESNLSREQLQALTASLPYSLSEVGPPMGPKTKDKKGRTVYEGGAGNYLVEVLAHKTDHSALSLWFLDTHSYSPPEAKVDGYDWIKDYQIQWFKTTRASLQQEHAKYAFMHMDMAFIHIPLPEYRLTNVPMVGERREPPTSPQYNSGFKDALVEAGVPVVTAGHDHANDYCLLDREGEVDRIWLCYGGGAGFGGYGGYEGYQRRVRLWEFDAPEDRIRTWKRVETGDNGPLDVQTIVEGGKVMGPPQ